MPQNVFTPLVLLCVLFGSPLGAQSQEPFSLAGDWVFYKDRLLEPQDLKAAGPGVKYPVPKIWKWHDGPQSSYGHGTYVKVLEAPGLTDPVVFLPYIDSAFRLWVNGKFLASAGRVGTSEETSEGAWKPGLYWLPPTEDFRWELVLQVSNYQDISGGLPVAPTFGSAKMMTDTNRRQLIIEAFFFGALLLISFYHLGLYLFRMKDSSPLWFGLIALVLSTRILVDNQMLLYQLYPELPWMVFLKWSYLTFSLSVFLFPTFMGVVFPHQSWKPGLRIIQALALAYSLLVVFAPVGVFTSLLSIFHLITLFGALQIFVVLFRALKQKAPGAWVFFAGFLFFFLTVVHDLARVYIITPIPPLVPLGLLIFLLFQALVMARKFTAAFTAAENFSVYLKRLNVSLERFIPREVLSYLKKDSIVDVNLGDHIEMEMTVLFADIRNFTGLSEKMSPQENFNFINSYLNRMGPIIRRNGGFVDKYMGDGIMALFPGSPQSALTAALGLREELVRYNQDRKKSGYDPISIGIGLHTGQLMVGTIGEEGRMDSTVISDAVNLASRMEGLTKVYGEDILVSQAVVEGFDPTQRDRFRFLGQEKVKGKSEPVGVYGV